jgi:transposase
MQVNKTDKNDGYGLAQIVRTDWYKEVSVNSLFWTFAGITCPP